VFFSSQRRSKQKLYRSIRHPTTIWRPSKTSSSTKTNLIFSPSGHSSQRKTHAKNENRLKRSLYIFDYLLQLIVLLAIKSFMQSCIERTPACRLTIFTENNTSCLSSCRNV